ncbi:MULTISPECIES: 2,3-diphosphoglycerate-dependent phosphoglycerate mutase [unclassified Paenibacillus]|jgi:2,3-bisphosphoglycerate-dependent phosphoglycerate mutase|uniref:2,3-diphosphoglycerate-dependent phosphoglycerate mutase n=1 Tax=unclassified Paenibacillus TaxID=185978 RepID=UPI0004F89A64|nr:MULTISPECIES: 2,3-diphosphoglycerate-dependent phosphoglycerate mutase [unclassified Paenibacillus]AIQ32119.1 phosphoglyceromutase [Paenibacillus sp. FSL P4-0081]AIQ43460.1 phosphoglyceromutase [Paenibacillus sp. FSL R5-0912]OMF22836.1 phosphoglyceromutase [Paenibacillus sp. FSL H8-0259]
MYEIVLIRHGESEYNRQNLFTGWSDPDLTEKGVEEAKKAGKLLKDAGYTFDLAFASVLKRSIKTLNYVLDEMDLLWIPVQKSWKLNERHYGALQGLSKSETALKYGEEQLHIWRRSLSVRPPMLEPDDPRYARNDIRYKEVRPGDIPRGESLEDTVHRVGDFWGNRIVPLIRKKERVLISAHGNTLRALIKYMEDIDETALLDLNIPTGVPLVYKLDDDVKPISRFYLGEPEEVQEKAREVANQSKVTE